jgi:hypothetical protein
MSGSSIIASSKWFFLRHLYGGQIWELGRLAPAGCRADGSAALTDALDKEELRSEAAEMLRSMIQASRPGFWRSPTKKAPGLLGRGLDN